MADLNLTNQQAVANSLQTSWDNFKNRTDTQQRFAFWRATSYGKRKAWFKSGKDPVLLVLWQIKKDLDTFFATGDEDDDNIEG